jgi:predicted Zn-dependent peptidase
MVLVRESLLRELEQNKQDNSYILGQISRRYADGDAANVVVIEDLRDAIAALTGDAIQQAAQTYLNTGSYVKVTLIPEGR